MKRGYLHKFAVIALLSIVLIPEVSPAESQVYNGATCVPYPPYDDANAVPYTYYMFGFRQSAFCHITMSDDRPVDELSYVLFTGSVSSGTLGVRLCVYSTSSYVCGPTRTITGSGSVNWVAPPGSPPSYASGAYLRVSFPTDVVSVFRQYIPVWTD